jgi:hypothetical protein
MATKPNLGLGTALHGSRPIMSDEMNRDIVRRRIERYKKLLEAAGDEAERRFIFKLLEQERAKLEEENPKNS